SFLGFTHYMKVWRDGRAVLTRKTQGRRMRKKLNALNQRLRSMRVQGGRAMQEYVRRHLTGHIQYYGISGNSRGGSRYVYVTERLWFKWLNRRSQRRSFDWNRYSQWLRTWIPRPCIVHAI